MKPTERQIGKITAIRDNFATVRVQRQSACAACSARRACRSSECSYSELRIPLDNFQPQCNDLVWVVTDMREGMRALLLAYIVPLVLMLAAFAIAYALGCGEIGCAVTALAILPAYYLLLHGYERRRGQSGNMRIEPYNE